MKIVYCTVPAMKSVFKVTEDCCFEQVVYEGPAIGVTAKNDSDGDILNSHDLICDICNPGLTIIPISRREYYSIMEEVNKKRRA